MSRSRRLDLTLLVLFCGYFNAAFVKVNANGQENGGSNLVIKGQSNLDYLEQKELDAAIAEQDRRLAILVQNDLLWESYMSGDGSDGSGTTSAPETTGTPDTTESTEATGIPDTTESTEATGIPDTTESTEATGTPDSTKFTGATEDPETTGPTEATNVTDTITATDSTTPAAATTTSATTTTTEPTTTTTPTDVICRETCVGCVGPCYESGESCVCSCIDGFNPVNKGCQPVQCEKETVDYKFNNTIQVVFPATQAGYTTPSTSTCPEDTSNAGQSYGTRACSVLGEWEDPVWISECDVNLQGIADKTIGSEEDRQQAANDLEVITSNPADLQADNVTQVVSALENVLVNTTNLTQATSSSVVMTVSNILEMPEEQLQASEQTDQLLSTLDEVAEKVVVDEGETYEEVTSTLAMAVMKPTEKNATNGFGYEVKSISVNQSLGFRSDQLQTFTGNPNENDSTFIKVPLEAARQSSDGLRTSFYAMPNNKLFISRKTPGRWDMDLTYTSNVVLTATVVGQESITNLKDPVEMKFTLEEQSGRNYMARNTYCAYWVNEDWSTDGAKISSVEGGAITCSFDHLTNFAALFNSNYVDSAAIDLITLIGCSISSVCLAVTIVVYGLERTKNMNRRAAFLLVNLSVSLLLLNLTLIFSGQNFVIDNAVACQSIAVVLHFFVVSSMAWMLVEGANLFLSLVFPMFMRGSVSNKKIYGVACAVGWFVPAIFVACAVGIDNSLYVRIDYTCWIKDEYLLYLAAIPLIVFIGINLVLYVLILYNVMCKKDRVRSSYQKTPRRHVIMSVTLFVTMGGTWLFAIALIVTKEDVAVLNVFAYIFAILNSLQGVFIFLLYVMRREVLKRVTAKQWSRAADTMQHISTSISRLGASTSRQSRVQETELSEIRRPHPHWKKVM